MPTLLKLAEQTKILIVDDRPDNLRLLAKILESQSYSVRKSLNGRMAIQAIHRHPPDLILLDINMPEMNGYEVCQQLKACETTAEIPIIFISAIDRMEDKVQAFELGGVDYITKPFQEQEILMRVKNQLLIQQQHQRLEQEIQERLRAEAQVKHLSLTDELTGLYNRRGFFLLAEQQLKMARRTQKTCSLLLVDLDGLKKINDTLGHEMGDIAIVYTAEILKQTFPDSDIVARIGGDEFAIFIPACIDNTDNFETRLQVNIDCFNVKHDNSYQLSMSLGVKQCHWHENFSLEQLVTQADNLMYERKRSKCSATLKADGK